MEGNLVQAGVQGTPAVGVGTGVGTPIAGVGTPVAVGDTPVAVEDTPIVEVEGTLLLSEEGTQQEVQGKLGFAVEGKPPTFIGIDSIHF